MDQLDLNMNVIIIKKIIFRIIYFFEYFLYYFHIYHIYILNFNLSIVI
jgi:hypothetical protein